MKKLLLTLLLSLAIPATSFASSSIKIDYAKANSVLNLAANFYATLNPGYANVKQDENSIILAAKTNAESNAMKQVRFAVSQSEKYVTLNMESVNVNTDANGKRVVEKLSEPANEQLVLCTVKSLFNDHYSFGYVLSNDYKDGGFVIDVVEMGSAAKEAGIKPGDILTHVNKKAILASDAGLYNDKVLPSCFTGKETEFTILSNGEVKTVKITPEFEPALLRQ